MANKSIVQAHGYSPLSAVIGNKKTKVKNSLLTGAGGNTLQDRGALQTPAMWTLNPYNNNNFMLRWQTYTNLYFTSWEAKKIVEIPVNDAFRIKPNLVGISEDEKMALMNAMDKIDGWEKMRRAAIQERLLGGCAILLGVRDSQDDPAQPIDMKNVDKGDLQFLNVITINSLSNPEYDTDPFSPGFDKPKYYQINGIKTHVSRLIVFATMLRKRLCSTTVSIRRDSGNLSSLPCGMQSFGVLGHNRPHINSSKRQASLL